MHAYESADDFEGMLAAGNKSLAGNPDNLNTLLALAPAMASRASGRSDQLKLLNTAQAYAKHSLEIIDATHISKKVSAADWLDQKRQMQSVAHGVLGVVALQQGQGKVSVNELQSSVDLSPKPEGIQFLRLGLAYRLVGDKAKAKQSFAKAVELGPKPISDAAHAELIR
jgi:tetratricopeptide (TPR) repeat protein